MARFLFGPVTRAFADENLAASRAAGVCLTFGRDADLPVHPGDTWDDVAARLPPGWRPDFVAAWLQYQSHPPAVWGAPVPILGLAGDWNLQWHAYRHVLPLCDAVLVDEPGAAVFRRAGHPHAYPANLYGLGRTHLDRPDTPDVDRDIDVLFVGNISQAVQRERAAWLARVARLADRYRVVIRTGVFGAEYRKLLRRAKLAFNRSIRGECNMRALEAPAAGAVLLQEAENREVRRFLTPDTEYVPYTAADFEERVARVLADDERRRVIAAAGRAKVTGYSFETLFRDGVARVFRDPAGVTTRMAARLQRRPGLSLTGRLWTALGSREVGDRTLAAELIAAGRHEAAVLTGTTDPDAAALVGAAVTNRVAALTRAEFLRMAGRGAEAVSAARAVLVSLDVGPSLTAAELDTPPYPAQYDFLRVEWERAGWAAAADPAAEAGAKAALLRARAHALVGELTGSLADYRAAVEARPDLPKARATYGVVLARAGRPAEAAPHLRAAAEALPLSAPTARAYYQVLLDLGETAAAAAFAEGRQRLAVAAPDLVPPESWRPGSLPPRPPTRVVPQTPAEVARRFGAQDTSRALCRFTPVGDTHVVLALVAALCPVRVLEIGTADGAMTANLTAWTPPGAVVFTLGLADAPAAGGAAEQAAEVPTRDAFGRHADHFGQAHKVFFVTANSRTYDFGRFGPLDFVFVDGGHDLDTVLSDSRKGYAALRPGGCMAWHDYGSSVPWVRVTEAVGRVGFAEPVFHVTGTQVAYLIKAGPPGTGAAPDPGPEPVVVDAELRPGRGGPEQ